MSVATTDFIRNLGQVLRYRHAGQDARDRAKGQLEHISRTGSADARKQAEAELASSLVDHYTASGIAIRKTS
jgi:hypothetical protein